MTEKGVETGEVFIKKIMEEFGLTKNQATEKFEQWAIKNAEAGVEFQNGSLFDILYRMALQFP